MLVPHDESNPHSTRQKKSLAVLGSTGSIGVSTLEVVRANPESFEIFGLVAHSRADELLAQIEEFHPRFAVLVDEKACSKSLRERSKNAGTELLVGDAAVIELVRNGGIQIVVAAIVGMAGLPSTLAALEAGKTVALANKESLVVAGELVKKTIERGGGKLLPVDSEHSAIYQALRGDRKADIASVILTASGGPFLQVPKAEWGAITPEQAVKHPRWNMGKKVSIDSATMMNKALEVIEAHWLFGVSTRQIEVVVHPQSIVHSLVRYRDGSLLAQLSTTDMKGPIAFALSYPDARIPDAVAQLNLAALGSLTFQALDTEKFPGPRLALESIDLGGAASAVLNICNEWAVAEFLEGRLTFDRISSVVERGLNRFGGLTYETLDDLKEVENVVLGVLRNGEMR